MSEAGPRRAPLDHAEARAALDLAARLGLRGWGHVEPNPMVGCVLVRPRSAGQLNEPLAARLIGMGHHRRFGGPHAEAEALAHARALGHSPRGSTAYCTLEPCAARGKQPPCADALIEAGVARVVCAAADPTPSKGGGAACLRAAGIEVALTDASRDAVELSRPWIKRVTTGLPWVIAKWAQTLDGKVATRTGESRWISGERSRAAVHRTRGRVDAILTGISTVKADNPRLDARGVTIRRRAARVVIDPALQMPAEAAMYSVTEGGPIVRVASADAKARQPAEPRREEQVVFVPGDGRHIDLRAMLATLASRSISTVLSECGPGLQSALLAAGLVDELHIYLAPTILGDGEARAAVRGWANGALADAVRFERVFSKSIGPDTLLVLRHPINGATFGT